MREALQGVYGGGRFLCRLCLRLRYGSQYETPGGRARGRAQKLRMRLGGSANLLMRFPFRPKHMQRRTYRRLIELDDHLLGRTKAKPPPFAERPGKKIIKNIQAGSRRP